MMKARITTMGFVCWLFVNALQVHGEKVNLTFDHFYDGPAVVQALRDLHEAYTGLTEIRSIGQSEEGRDIWLLTINNPKTGADTEKPGVYVDGSIHGNEIQATEVCLYLAWYLLDHYDDIPVVHRAGGECGQPLAVFHRSFGIQYRQDGPSAV
jgi:murein tripeptide amidase MpaA